MEQPYSAKVPWVGVSPGAHGWHVRCGACGALVSTLEPSDVDSFASIHATHQASEGYLGLGDAVAAVAKPIARMFGRAPCTPCEARRRSMNQMVRRPW